MPRLLNVMLVCLMMLIGAGVPAVAKDITIDGIRFGQNGTTTRFVLDVSSEATPSIFLLADPYRVVIDLPEANWRTNGDVKTSGVVDGYRHGLFSPGVYRIVLDLKAPATIANSFTLPPNGQYSHRLVLDIEPTSRSSFLSAVQSSKSERPSFASASVPDVTAPRKRISGKRVVVIDAGHGGPDPGNLGVIGVHEKIVVLEIARAIRDELNKTGRYQVHMTRDRDIFHPVRERFRIARRHHADLFISVHADSIKNPNVSGASVYNLSETASDREAARLAARENKSDVIAGVNLAEADDDVSSILIDLAQRETMNFSAQYANILVQELGRDVPLLQRTHRFANLGVLKAPDVPSVLLEAGYLTNKSNARFINSSDGRKKIAQAVRRATDRYFQQMVALGR
ncbi:N-acetylmuramoyl-L-alanine amidase [Kordiimonas aestuarii]|uniref:N-acetylmuramoyl-L-alanine amidase n=1 Tax=Kordiimonas aestuarii TaxID=1005925 RepID=UPI0021CEB820|nr:N-acetylmuramoyl-L-alanine amidase [Kordiimonas aestuarii]